MVSKFDYLKNNLSDMAELILEQVILLSETLENDNLEGARYIIERDDLIDELEKENDNLSQNAILEAVASLEAMRKNEGEPEFKNDPLRFALSAIRITRSFERMGDQVVNVAKAFSNGYIREGIFKNDEDLTLIISRVVTIVGIAVESLVEEKDRFFGSVQLLEDELDLHCNNFFLRILEDEDKYSRREFADLYRIQMSIERLGDLAVNIAMELVRLVTGQDIRHLYPSLSSLDMT